MEVLKEIKCEAREFKMHSWGRKRWESEIYKKKIKSVPTLLQEAAEAQGCRTKLVHRVT